MFHVRKYRRRVTRTRRLIHSSLVVVLFSALIGGACSHQQNALESLDQKESVSHYMRRDLVAGAPSRGGEAARALYPDALDLEALAAEAPSSLQHAEAAFGTALARSGNAQNPEPADAPGEPLNADRKVVYTGLLNLIVPNLSVAREQIEAIIRENGGFVQRATLTHITFRVPPAQFKNALHSLEQLGEVHQREVSSQDVTDQYADLQLRIEVARKSKERLLALLDKQDEVKDLLEVERDLRRLTQEIEQLEGQLRALSHRVDWATIQVNLAERQIETTKINGRQLSPNRFAWMATLGLDRLMVDIPAQAPLDGGPWLKRVFQGRAFHLKTADKHSKAPEGFVILKDSGQELVAASAEDYRLRVQALQLRRESSLAFWTQALREELARNRGYLVEPSESVSLNSDELEAQCLSTTIDFSGEAWRYEVWLIRRIDKPKELCVVEFGIKSGESAEEYRARVLKAVEGIRLG